MTITRLAFITDQHFDERADLAATARIHKWIAQDARDRGCVGSLLGGDFFERRDTPAERNAGAEHLLDLAKMGPVVGVYGNHESANSLEIYNLIGHDQRIHFHDRPAVDVIDEVAIACLPWPRAANLLAQAGDVGAEEVSNLAQHHLRNVLRGLGAELDQMPPEYARTALAHVMIDGAKTDHDQPLVGMDMALSLQDLGLMRAGIYCCGHVHAQNEFDIAGAPCIYGGAPDHNNFGEPGPKGYVVLTFDGPRLVSFERIATPATPMWLLSGRWQDKEIALDRAIPDVSGARVRLRFDVPADEREAAGLAAETVAAHLRDLGADSVKLEPQVIATKRARAPEVALAATTEDKVVAHWNSISFEPGARRDPLIAKVRFLDAEDQSRAA